MGHSAEAVGHRGLHALLKEACAGHVFQAISYLQPRSVVSRE